MVNTRSKNADDSASTSYGWRRDYGDTRQRSNPSAPPMDDLDEDDDGYAGGQRSNGYPNSPPPAYDDYAGSSPRTNAGRPYGNGRANAPRQQPDQWSWSDFSSFSDFPWSDFSAFEAFNQGPLRVLYPLIWVVKKFGWWLLVIMFPFVFGPIFAIQKLISRSTRAYQAARYAQDRGYFTSLWDYFQVPIIKLVVLTIRTATMGQVDLTEYAQREWMSADQRASTLRSGRQWRSNNADDTQFEEDLRTDSNSLYGNMLSPVTRVWSVVKMLGDLVMLGFYFMFGWTFGRFVVDEDGQLTTKRGRGRPARRPSATSSSNDAPPPYRGQRENSSPRWWPWILVLGTVLAFGLYTYNNAQRYPIHAKDNKLFNM